MKNILDVSKRNKTYILYFSESIPESDDEINSMQSLVYDNEDQAIGAGMALLSVVNKIYFASVYEVITSVYFSAENDDMTSECIWEACAEEAEDLDKKMYS